MAVAAGKAIRMANKPRKSTQLVWITWRDAVGGDRIHRDDIERARLAVNTNLGWIEHEDDQRIVLCHGFSNTGEYEYTQIPISDIIKRIPVVKRTNRQPKKLHQPNPNIVPEQAVQDG